MTVFWGKTAVTVKQGKLTDEAEGKRVFFFAERASCANIPFTIVK